MWKSKLDILKIKPAKESKSHSIWILLDKYKYSSIWNGHSSCKQQVKWHYLLYHVNIKRKSHELTYHINIKANGIQNFCLLQINNCGLCKCDARTNSVEADFSIINWARDSNVEAYTDLSLKLNLHVKQLRTSE